MSIEIDLEELLKQAQPEEEPEKYPIDRGQWMEICSDTADHCVEKMMSLADKYQKWQERALEIHGMQDKICELEDNDYRINYFIDDKGNLSYEAHPKGKLGFSTPEPTLESRR